MNNVKKSAEDIVSYEKCEKVRIQKRRKALEEMRKNRLQQKNEKPEQLELFSRRARKSDNLPTDGISRGSLPEVELLSELKRMLTLTKTILDELLSNANLTRAYRQVKQNGGIGGTDKMELAEFGDWLGKNLDKLRASLLNGSYKISPVLKVEIPKASGGKRILGIPTLKDRLIQQSIMQELSRYYEPLFSEHSYGFRQGRSAHQAILQSSEYISQGGQWVVDIDLEDFFDNVNHDRLLQRLSKGIGDKRLLILIKNYLKAGIMEDGLERQRLSGTPQGSPLSPLLSNIVLDELDKELEGRGHSFCRYADDCNIYVKSKKAGERVLAKMTDFIEKKLKLKVNRQKSGVFHCSRTKFLGYTLLPEGGIRVSDNSVYRLKEKLRQLTKRNRGVSFTQVITEVNKVVIGWSNYFILANKWLSDLRRIDSWLRRKLRCYRLKQCGRIYSIYKYLRSLEVPKQKAWNVVMYTRGWWAMSRKVAVGHAMSLKWFAMQGLESLSLRMNL